MSATSLQLWPHPATPCPPVHRLQVTVDTVPGASAWRLRYTLAGDLAALRLPAAAARPQTADGLWHHSCFEAFVAAEGAPGYHEFNFSPSGDWAAYAFSAERVRDPQAPPLPAPRIICAHASDGLTLEAWLPNGAVPTSAAPHWLGLSAVIETAAGQLSYWALAHPRAQPDFHHRAGWTARLHPLTLTP